jgi:hypothetical protein
MKRYLELDVVRGFLLVLMVVNHSPSPLRRFTEQPFGFFSTAEAFVFISALLAGLLFERRSEEQGFSAARAATLRRALRIYQAHIITTLSIFFLSIAFLTEVPGIRQMLQPFFDNPRSALLGSLALLFQPPLLDILPMYVLFSLLTPLAFWVAKRWGWGWVFGLSMSIWLFSQFRVWDQINSAGSGLRFLHLGPFDLFAWQLLWIGGLLFGRSLTLQRPLFQPTRPVEILLLLMASGFLVWRYLAITSAADPSTLWFLDKWHLGPLRVLNFFVTAWSIAKLMPMLRRQAVHLTAFSMVGRNMLPVFSAQIGLSVLLLAYMSVRHHQIEQAATVLVLLQVASIFAFGWLCDRWLRPRAVVMNPSLAPSS